ncbi:MAG: murein peptide amidase A [Acidobacteria bacterium]|nr:MAG: murein peptide amidase A [Acidobacteriota bacterium]
MLIPRSQSGKLNHYHSVYGQTVEGNPLVYWHPKDTAPEIVVMASIHGDEAETTVVLSEALRYTACSDLRCAVILAANPDGMMRGTRCNARGVDLNRNMPTENWTDQPVTYRSREGEPRDIELSTGEFAGSEPENQALIKLIEKLKPQAIVTLHAALACIDDPSGSPLAKTLAKRTGLPLVEDVGYPCPGSFGTWAGERGLNLVTYEVEADSLYNLKKKHVPVLIDLLLGKLNLEA